MIFVVEVAMIDTLDNASIRLSPPVAMFAHIQLHNNNKQLTTMQRAPREQTEVIW